MNIYSPKSDKRNDTECSRKPHNVFTQAILIFLLVFVFTQKTSAAPTQVWVNAKSHVYHCPGARWYGKTKRGFFIAELRAIKKGNRPSRGVYCSSEARNFVQKFAKSEKGNTKVWVNTKSSVYHCPGARWYGNTKNGRFMSEGNAISQGVRPAHGVRCN